MFPKKMKKITCGVLGVKANIRAGNKNYGYILSVEGVYSLTDLTCRDLTVDRIWVNNTIAIAPARDAFCSNSVPHR